MDSHAIVITGPDGVIGFWNSGAEAAFGHTAGDAVGQTLDLIIPPEFRAMHWAGFRRAMQSGAAEAEGNPGPFPALCADGAIRERLGMLILLRGPTGVVVGAMAAFAPPE